MSVDQGWVSMYSLVISSYCYIILLTMSFIFMLGGTLLTGIAFRPQQVLCQCGQIIISCRDAPDTDLAGYPANLKTGYRISGRISGQISGEAGEADFRLNTKINSKIN
jgi:hypothetical protein